VGGLAEDRDPGPEPLVEVAPRAGEEDRRIAELLVARDPQGTDLLYQRFGGLAYALALRVLGDRTAAEDVVQESFLAIWRRAESFDPARGQLRQWVCAVVHHRAIDRLRGSRIRWRRDVPLDAAPPEGLPADPFQEVSDVLVRDAVRSALAQLPPEQRETIELAFFAGLSHTEISDRMKLPVGTVKGRARLGMRRLHRLLSGQAAQEWLS